MSGESKGEKERKEKFCFCCVQPWKISTLKTRVGTKLSFPFISFTEKELGEQRKEGIEGAMIAATNDLIAGAKVFKTLLRSEERGFEFFLFRE